MILCHKIFFGGRVKGGHEYVHPKGLPLMRPKKRLSFLAITQGGSHGRSLQANSLFPIILYFLILSVFLRVHPRLIYLLYPRSFATIYVVGFEHTTLLLVTKWSFEVKRAFFFLQPIESGLKKC
jgi:hypothetical protein